MKKLIFLLCLIILVGCNSNEKNVAIQKKIDLYFENSSNVNLDKDIRLKYIDSAEKIIQKSKESDSLIIKNYFKVANRYFALFEYNKYKSTTNKILSIANKKKDSLNIAKAEYYLGDYYFSNSINDSAYFYYLAAEKKYKILDDQENLARTLLHKSYVLNYEKDFLGSESETIKVLNIAKKNDDQELVYECYVNLGTSLLGLGNFERALDYHQKSLIQIKKINDTTYKPIFQAQSLNNIGYVYLTINKFKEASEIFQEGLKINNIEELQPVLYTALLDNYAFSRFKINPNEGLENFKKALEIRDETGDIYGKIYSRIHLTEYYLAKKDTLKALQLNNEANTLAKESNFNKEVLQTLDFYTKLKPKEGLKYAKEYIRLSDSLQLQERLTRNKLARIEFETNEILLEKEVISNRFRIILISSMLIIFFGVLFYIILYLRGKHRELLFTQEQQKANEEIYKLMLDKQEEMDEVKKKEKLRISQELHDSVMNKLAGTRLNLFVLTKKRDEETIQKCLEHINGIQDIEKEIRTIAHELHNESFISNGSYRSLLEQLIQNQKDTYQTKCECNIDPEETFENISALIKMNVYRILQETLNNINKHAKATKISLSLYIENNCLRLKIQDNGVGFNMSKSKNGIGLKNMMSRAEAINGKLEVDSEVNKGTTVCLKVDL